jgi:hypothetical protein
MVGRDPTRAESGGAGRKPSSIDVATALKQVESDIRIVASRGWRFSSEAEEDLSCVVRDPDLDTSLMVGSGCLLDIQLTNWNSAMLPAHLDVNEIRRKQISTRFQTVSVRQHKKC